MRMNECVCVFLYIFLIIFISCLLINMPNKTHAQKSEPMDGAGCFGGVAGC